MLEAVARCLSSGSGPGGINLVSLHHWLMQFVEAIIGPQENSASFMEWLENHHPLWEAAYQTLMSVKFNCLDKHHGIRLVVVD